MCFCSGLHYKRSLLLPAGQHIRHGMHIIVPAPREANYEHRIRGHRRRRLHGMRYGVRGFERRYYALRLREKLEPFERFSVRNISIADAARIAEIGMLGSDARVVQARGE